MDNEIYELFSFSRIKILHNDAPQKKEVHESQLFVFLSKAIKKKSTVLLRKSKKEYYENKQFWKLLNHCYRTKLYKMKK